MVTISKTTDSKYQYLTVLIFGRAGTGKTHFLGTYDNKKTLIINVKQENGLKTLSTQGIDIDVINVNGKKEMLDAVEWIKQEGHKKYEVVGIDSFTAWHKNLENEYCSANFAMWSDIKKVTAKIVEEFKSIPVHSFFLGTLDIKEDDDGIMYLPSFVGKSKTEIDHFFDDVYFFEKLGKAGDMTKFRALTQSGSKYPCKTRLNGLPVIIDNPTIPKILDYLPKELKQNDEADYQYLDRLISEKNIPRETIFTEYKVKELKELNLDQRLDLEKRLKLKKG